jgi:hypothetical protein
MAMNQKMLWQMAMVTLAVGLSLLSSNAQAQLGGRKPADPRVASVLERIGWKYDVDGDGDYRLAFAMEGERNGRFVFINSRTEALGTLEVREVWSPAFRLPAPLPADVMSELLEENGRMILGGWRVLKGPEGCIAVFAAQIAADSDPAAVGTVVQTVSLAAHTKARRFPAPGARQSAPSVPAPSGADCVARTRDVPFPVLGLTPF